MNKSGPIIIIEDDMDDQEILQEVFNELKYKNEIKTGAKVIASKASISTSKAYQHPHGPRRLPCQPGH